MDNQSWLEVWAEFRQWYRKLVKDQKAPSWRKQQRQIHRLVETKIEKMGQPRVKRGRGRPRKYPVENHMGAHAEAGKQIEAMPVVEKVAEPTPGAH